MITFPDPVFLKVAQKSPNCVYQAEDVATLPQSNTNTGQVHLGWKHSLF